MALSDRRRKTLFVLALAVLIVWSGAVAVLGSGAGGRERGAGAGKRPGLPAPTDQPAGDPLHSAGATSALEFLAAYLRYERGATGRVDRETLARLSTPVFGRQLLQAPVRPSAVGEPQREWVSRVGTVRISLFEGRQALLVGVIVVAPGDAHVVTPTLVRVRGRWLVAGVGA